MSNQCQHGQLRRQCEICERDDSIQRLVNAFECYMAACACYHDNQWDLVNIRNYAASKARAEAVLSEFREAAES